MKCSNWIIKYGWIDYFSTEVFEYLSDKFTNPLFVEIDIQYFMNNIHIGNTVFYEVNGTIYLYTVDEYVLKTGHIPLKDNKFIIIQECYYCIENYSEKFE